MKKSELVKIVAAQTNISVNDTKKAMDTLLMAITRSLKRGPVHISGFGTFRLQHRKSRVGRHPRTGEPIENSDCTFPIFVAGKEMKDRINS